MQLLALSGLERLHLEVNSDTNLLPASCTALGRLTSLRHLGLAGFGNVPLELLASLRALRQLEALHLHRLASANMEWVPWYFTDDLGDSQEQQEAEAQATAARAVVAAVESIVGVCRGQPGC